MKWCSRCERERPHSDFNRDAARSDGLFVFCRDCGNAYYRERERQLRQRALDALGGTCAHCGIADRRVLAIDHVCGDGGRHRRGGGPKQTSLYIKIAADPRGYQVLCHNCNWIKRLEVDGRSQTTMTLPI